MSVFYSSIVTTPRLSFFFFFNDTATTEIYTLSLHDALPISIPGPNAVAASVSVSGISGDRYLFLGFLPRKGSEKQIRSEEHTSELQSQSNLVCRLLLEKKKKQRECLAYTASLHSRLTPVCSA